YGGGPAALRAGARSAAACGAAASFRAGTGSAGDHAPHRLRRLVCGGVLPGAGSVIRSLPTWGGVAFAGTAGAICRLRGMAAGVAAGRGAGRATGVLEEATGWAFGTVATRGLRPAGAVELPGEPGVSAY